MLLALAIWLLTYCISGRYLTYVTPRMLPYLIGTVFVFVVLAGVTLTRLFRPNRRARVVQVFVLALPLILLLLPHGVILASSNQLSSVASASSQSTVLSATPAPATAASEATSNSEEMPLDAIPGLDRDAKSITITTENYYDWMERLYQDAAVYEGYTVSMTGYVINGSDVFAEDEFALARMVMTCCVADITPIGFICKYSQASQLNADEWVSVEGVLIAGSYQIGEQTYTEPQLNVTAITSADKIEGYVYPY